MRKRQECVAMLLAGGEGKRLGVLTSNIAKPAVHFGGEFRIIDFTLSNCKNSGIHTIGVMTQYKPEALHNHIGNGSDWGMDHKDNGISLLPSRENNLYSGTANAVFQNMAYLDQFEPSYVLIISGDHIYNMDYQKMLEHHKQTNADVTISVMPVSWSEASRFGIMTTDANHRITQFTEKPMQPESNLASMGVYIFSYPALKAYLLNDSIDPQSAHDFGSNIIPELLKDQAYLVAYPFSGYWKDVGTIESLWDAHMDMLDERSELQLNQAKWPIYSKPTSYTTPYKAPISKVSQSVITNGCKIYGEINHSVLFTGVKVGKGSRVKDSVIMPNVRIGRNVTIYKAIIGEGAVIEDGVIIGYPTGDEITVIGEKAIMANKFEKSTKMLPQFNFRMGARL
ncbi:glucose-1-phosphate adenylyltransferase [Paenibacillus psychroresistens]|uniref:Glucose-1-phosphate adenylyltransferase n=1 Tax=Paenibacillus psychroresistens TaxID=1778678 RepID=A0A6B8RGC5_9BACL|nr:glucose-1-phosphate adenylyltransferase [Paenibacillus psychroresistens]QGQ94774.1 glucose-1-phosphate adenylyltransferase [Paenibacillus psychroresistens]